MKLVDYHRMRLGIQRNASPGDQAAAADMRERLRTALTDSGLFRSVEVDCTSDEDRLVIALAHYAPHMSTPVVAARIEQLWRDVIAYPFWSAESVLVEDGHVELQGSTRISQQGHYLTLHLIAQAQAPVVTASPEALVPAQGTSRHEGYAAPAVPSQASATESAVEATRSR